MEPTDSSGPAEPEPRAGDDPAQLVAQLAAAGEWPDPDLLERIVAAGDAAVEPLRELARTRPRGWPDEAPLEHAVGLLGEMKAASALPDLVAVARDYLGEIDQEIGAALARFGDEGFAALLGLIQDPSVVGYKRWTMVEHVIRVARSDDQKARLAETLRDLFQRSVAEAEEASKFEDELAGDLEGEAETDEIDDEELEEISDIDDLVDEEDGPVEPEEDGASAPSDPDEDRAREEAENELVPSEDLAAFAGALCDLADPLAKEMIKAAYDAELIDESIMDEKSFLRSYAEGPRVFEARTGWLEEYRRLHQEYLDRAERIAQMGPLDFPSRTSYPSFERTPEPSLPSQPPVEPIRNTGPRIGRNDPCWCGSGKKYKKCHLGKDSLT
jgi:hypothetical protein